MRRTETTRREFVGVGAAVGGALLAGCTSGDGNGTDDSSANGDSNGDAAAESTDDSSVDDGTYTVSIEPMGAVEFEGPPEQWVATESEFREAIIEPLREDPVASEVQAVQDEAVYNAGYPDQGPIINFYQTERAAKDIYPDAFEDATLFDRERVADIVTGEF